MITLRVQVDLETQCEVALELISANESPTVAGHGKQETRSEHQTLET